MEFLQRSGGHAGLADFGDRYAVVPDQVPGVPGTVPDHPGNDKSGSLLHSPNAAGRSANRHHDVAGVPQTVPDHTLPSVSAS